MSTIAIKERPILFHARSINGILEGRKTQTRRIIKPQPSPAVVRGWCTSNVGGQADLWNWLTAGGSVSSTVRCHYGQPGDRLWVRETFCDHDFNFGGNRIYRADGEFLEGWTQRGLRWKPSIHMPRVASRLTLEITDIRVERVRDISDRDCEAEGVRPSVDGTGQDWRDDETGWRRTFRQLWDDTNGKGAWNRNDWVWVVGFRRVP